MSGRVKMIWLVPLLAAAAACATARKAPFAAPGPPPVDWAAKLAEADKLCAAGHYAGLREALATYREALKLPEPAPDIAEKAVRASVALELRKRELGILPAEPFPERDTLSAAGPVLSRYEPWVELLEGLPAKIKGYPGLDRIAGRTLEQQLDWVAARVPDLDRELEREAPGDDLAAALRLALRAAFAYKFADKLETKPVLDLHPGSRLLSFQAAMSPAYDFEGLEELAAAEPGFAEVDYFLGEAALLSGKVLTAERRYLAVLGGIPESLSVLISLAKVAFQMEETESCLDWNEKALAILPTYRDALLGKGLALGYLGRNEEALEALGRLLELGTYYLGEGRFWTAWNLNELGRLDEARRAVDAAKVFLVDIADVYSLSGVIAYRQGRLDEAEKDLLRALGLQPDDADAAFHLGRLYADRKDWLSSGIYFAGAAAAYEDKERGLEKKIEEIEASDLAPERQARLVAKKRFQIVSAQLTKATSQYNGAAGFHNAGAFDRALDLARRAAGHAAFAERAAELVKLILERQAPGPSSGPRAAAPPGCGETGGS